MRWTAASLLRPVTFVLSIVAAVVTGNATDSFWLGTLGFFIAMGVGRVIGAIARGRTDLVLAKAIWPAAAAAFAFFYAWLGLPTWANFFVSWISASLTKFAVVPRTRWHRVEWRRIDLDELLP